MGAGGVEAEAVLGRGRWTESVMGLLEVVESCLFLDALLPDDVAVQRTGVVALGATVAHSSHPLHKVILELIVLPFSGALRVASSSLLEACRLRL